MRLTSTRVAAEAVKVLLRAGRVLQRDPSAARRLSWMRSGMSVSPSFRSSARCERDLFVVFDDEKPGEPEIGLLAREVVRMRVIPVGAGAIGDGELVVVSLAGTDRVVRVAVVVGVVLEAVPVHDAGLVERVPVAHAQVRALVDAQQRIDERAAVVLERVAEHRRGLAGQDFLAGRRAPIERERAADVGDAVQFGVARDLQRVGKERIGRRARDARGRRVLPRAAATADQPAPAAAAAAAARGRRIVCG